VCTKDLGSGSEEPTGHELISSKDEIPDKDPATEKALPPFHGPRSLPDPEAIKTDTERAATRTSVSGLEKNYVLATKKPT